eukprot:COSAG06_NODE_661_length_13303_cov_26.208725_1_plen_234_part_10
MDTWPSTGHPKERVFEVVRRSRFGVSSVFGAEFGSGSAQHRAQNTLQKPEKTERVWGAFSAKFGRQRFADSAGKHFGFCAADGFRARSAASARLAAIPAAQRSPSEVPKQLCRAAVNQAPSWGSTEGRETSQNSLLRPYLGRVSARTLRTGRRGGFAARRTAGERRIAPMGAGSSRPARGGRGHAGVSGWRSGAARGAATVGARKRGRAGGLPAARNRGRRAGCGRAARARGAL